MLLLGTLAAVMLSLSSIAIIKSHSRRIAMTQAEQSSAQARLTSRGLLQRCVAIIQADPLFAGVVTDRDLAIPGAFVGAFAQVTAVDPSTTRIEVYLYSTAPVPSDVRVVDPTSL